MNLHWIQKHNLPKLKQIEGIEVCKLHKQTSSGCNLPLSDLVSEQQRLFQCQELCSFAVFIANDSAFH